MAEQEMFSEAMEAIQQGDRKRGRDLISRLLKVNPNNIEYWIWMSAVVDSSQERIYCLQEVLKRDPQNATARRGLVIMGVIPAEPNQMPPPGMLQRNWQVTTPASTEEEHKPSEMVSRATIVTVAFFVVAIGLVIGFVIRPMFTNTRNQPTAYVYIPTFPTSGPSPTSLITFTPVVKSPTPTFIGPTPLWMQMESTYTPTPLYVNTPHPQIEAYRAAMTAYARGDLNKAITFFQQVIASQADAVDVMYYLGECYRQLGDYSTAIDYYNEAIKAQPAFAAPYLGRAKANYARDPKSDVMPDLQNAIDRDPELGEAYLEEGIVAFNHQDYTSSLNFLTIAGEKLPGSTEVALYQAKVYLAEGMPAEALTAARQANQLDFTSLPAYYMLGEALQANQMYSEAVRPLVIYLTYQSNDIDAWTLLGRVYSSLQDWPNAENAFSMVLTLDSKSVEGYQDRGEMYLAMGDGEKAAQDFSSIVKLSPRSFDGYLGLARAYIMQENYSAASKQLAQAKVYMKGDAQEAAYIFWLATNQQALDQLTAAAHSWESLLALPTDVVPTSWAATAQTFLTGTPTPMQTEEATPTQ